MMKLSEIRDDDQERHQAIDVIREWINTADVVERGMAPGITAPDPELSRRREGYATSRQAADRPNRIVETTVATARDLLTDVFDPETGGQTINTALLERTDPALRPIWAAELRTVLRELRMVISALEGVRRG